MRMVNEFPQPHPVQFAGSAFARWVLTRLGWQVKFEGLPALQGMVVVYPHTSNWDFIVLMLAKWAIGVPVYFWGKDSLFRIPLFGRWLRWLGGVPVVRNDLGRLDGVEAVVDKDSTASILAQALDADALLILTDVANVFRDFGTPTQSAITCSTPAAMRDHDFPAGSMGPKVEAACRFVEITGGIAGIGRLEDAAAILAGTAGTVLTPTGVL